jgi:hypothetical protein
MSNTLTNLIPDLYKALDVVSRELVGFIPAVDHNSSVEEAAKDQTVNIPVVGAIAAADITPGVTAPDTGDMTPANTTMTISESRYAPVRWNGEEQKSVQHTGIYENVQQARFAQAFRTLTNEIEEDLAGLHIYASRAYGVAGTTPFTTADNLLEASFSLKILDDNGSPDDRHIVMGTGATATLRGKQSGLFHVNEAGDGGSLLRSGAVGNMFGAEMHTSGQIASAAIGAGTGYVTNTAAAATLAIGAVTIGLDTGSGIILAGDVVTFAGDTNKYVVKTGITAAGNLVIQEPGLVETLADGVAMTSGAANIPNMVFARSAIVLATRVPAMPIEGDQAEDVIVITDPFSGLSFQIALYKQYRQAKFEVGIAWGVKAVAPRHIGLMLG